MPKTADKPHGLTVTLALLAAGISATGVYVSYKSYELNFTKQVKPSGERPGVISPPAPSGNDQKKGQLPTLFPRTEGAAFDDALKKMERDEKLGSSHDEPKTKKETPEPERSASDETFEPMSGTLEKCQQLIKKLAEAGITANLIKRPPSKKLLVNLFSPYEVHVSVAPERKEQVRKQLQTFFNRPMFTKEEYAAHKDAAASDSTTGAKQQ